MKKLAVLWVVGGLLALGGCVTDFKNPETGIVTKVADTNAVKKVVDTVAVVNAATAPINPYAPLIDPAVRVGGEIALGVSTLWAMLLNARKKKVLTAVVQGVESAGNTNDAAITLGDVKAAIFRNAAAAGVQPDLHAIVQENT